MGLIGKLEQFIIMDDNLRTSVYEDFEVAMRAAINMTTVNKMVTITMPDGRRFTLLETTRATIRR